MRIISGKAKGTKLYTLDGENTRPTLDRVKEAMFNIIQGEIEDAVVLDLFSGSGAIGLEFASRGAKKVYLVDSSKQACEIIKKNIEKTHMQEKTELFNIDAINLVEKIKNINFDIIYLDPPYKTDLIEKSICKLLENKNINDNTLIIAETDENQKIKGEIEKIKDLMIIDIRKYGRVYIFFLKKISRKEV